MARRKQPGDPSRVVGYVRVSTDAQELGPEAQRAALLRWCAEHGAELVAVGEDVVSGAADVAKRPGLLSAVAQLAEHRAGVLLVARRDRLARDAVASAVIERLAERQGARVLSACGTGNGDGPEARLMRGVVDLFAEYERDVIRGRTRAALAAKKARGELTGNAPIGWRVGPDGVHLEPDPAESSAVALIYELRGRGATIAGIARHLDAHQVPCRGRRWRVTTVWAVLQRPEAPTKGTWDGRGYDAQCQDAGGAGPKA